MVRVSTSWRHRRRLVARAGLLRCLAWTVPLIALVSAGPIAAAPCGNMSLRFFDKMPVPPVFLEPGEPPEHEVGSMQISTDSSRLMSSTFWKASYWILPASADGLTTTGETYWMAGSDSPILAIEFQRDRDACVTHEILLRPSPQNETTPGREGRIQGWYEYIRDAIGRIIEITYHSTPGNDGRWLTDDDFALSRVELIYESGARNPKEAKIFYAWWGGLPDRKDYDSRGGRLVTFVYDAQGGLAGGVRQDYWPTYFSVTSGSCSGAPERLFVLLLAPNGGPWHPVNGAGRGYRAADPR